jgi:PPK2 family polyphosphate:nucleotide phosphotransferase
MEQARLVKLGEKLKLKDEATKPPENVEKEAVLARIDELAPELTRLLDLFAFSAVHPLLLVFQGMDTAGKDGAARHLFGMSSILSARVAGFKRPTEEELAHDYLWRVHKQTPGKGELVLFNRSHYEDVLVVKVHGLAPAEAIEKRYDQINAFENHLSENGTMIHKFFLHISKKEQEERLLEREAEPSAAWKLAAGDWKEREKWDEYQDAYGAALSRCSTEAAPWQIIPADKKWYRNLLVTEALITALQARENDYVGALEKLGAARKSELAAYRTGLETA